MALLFLYYERQIIALTDVLARLNAERAELANGVKSEHPALVAFTKHQNIDQLSRELLVELIDHIKVYENGNIMAENNIPYKVRAALLLVPLNTPMPTGAVTQSLWYIAVRSGDVHRVQHYLRTERDT